jgi:hypothetical protein
MELKQYIKISGKMIIPIIDNIQLVDYKNKELDFVYGMQEYHTSFKRMFKQIKRILWR